MSNAPALLHSSGDAQIDTIVGGFIAVLELLFPQRIASYALTGSCADGAATALSDIDMLVVFASERPQKIAIVCALP
ncbi:hypothetical protein HC891_27750 [Candidatus Gracilibacteria bacterium]|nr:hypothetical protein [Candidatus Gracilibacteria bacterium]